MIFLCSMEKKFEKIFQMKKTPVILLIFLGKKRSFSIKENIPEDLTQSWPLGDKLSIENTSHQSSFSGLILGWGGEGLKRDLQQQDSRKRGGMKFYNDFSGDLFRNLKRLILCMTKVHLTLPVRSQAEVKNQEKKIPKYVRLLLPHGCTYI